MKKILIYGIFYKIGGITTHTIELSKILKKMNFEIVLVGLENMYKKDKKILKNQNVIFYTAPFVRKFSLLLKIYSFLKIATNFKKNSFDVLYVNGIGKFPLTLIRFLKKDGIFIFHHHGEIKLENLKEFLKISIKADYIIVNSEEIIKEYKNLIKNKRIVTISSLHNMTEDNHISNKLLSQRDPMINIAYIGRIEPGKGIERLLKVWEKSNLEEARLLIYGGGRLENYVKKYIKTKSLKNIYIKGELSYNDINKIYKEIDLILLLSDSEGLGLSIIEGLKQGIPFLATKTKGALNIAKEFPSFMLVDFDIDSCVQGLKQIVQIVKEKKINRRYLHEYYKKNFSKEILQKKWENFLKNIIKN